MRLGWAVLALTLSAAGARAAPPEGPWLLRTDILGGANPPGLLGVGGLFRRLARGEAGTALGASPAYGRATVRGEWLPWPFLKLAARADAFRFFGARAALLSFPSADSAHGTRERRDLAGREEAAFGRRAVLEPELRARWGRLVALNQTEWAFYRLDGRGPYVLELEYDTLLEKRDAVFVNRTLLLFEHKKSSLYYGPYFEHQRVRDTNLERVRLGLAVDASLGRPRFFGTAGFNLKDRNRRHQAYFAGGLRMEFAL